MACTVLWNYFETNCRALPILRSTIFASKNVKLSYFYDGTEIENICFRPERKSFCDSQSSEVFIIYCLTRKHKLLVLSYST